MEAAVCEVPEASAQEPLRSHCSLADNIEINPDERGILDLCGGINNRQSRPFQHFQQLVGVFSAQIDDDSIELTGEVVSCGLRESFFGISGIF